MARAEVEQLLGEARWMRALARSLLADAAAADDVVQDATLAALRCAPEDPRGLAPWLSGVVRNLARRRQRGDARRAEHESRAEPRRAEPTPAEIAERLDLQRALLDAVRGLEEPLRTALVLRWLEGRTSPEIAVLTGVPAATVRWRLARALERLRERLDARSGSRAGWALLLAPFAGSGSAADPRRLEPFRAPRLEPSSAANPGAFDGAQLALGAAAMKAGHVVAGATAAVVLGALAWWGWTATEPNGAARAPVALAPEQSLQPPDVAEEALVGAPERAVVPASAPDHGALAAAAQPVPAPAAALESWIAHVDARCFDPLGNPLDGVRLVARGSAQAPHWRPPESATSGADGRVALSVDLPVVRPPVGVPKRELRVELEATGPGLASLARTATLVVGETKHLGTLVMQPGGRIAGRVLDRSGSAVAGATVGVAPAALPGDHERAVRHGGEFLRTTPHARSDAAGAFVLEGAPLGAWRAWAHADGHRYVWSAPFDVPETGAVDGVELVLSPWLDGDRIAGRVVTPDGTPVAHAELWTSERSRGTGGGRLAPVDAQGRFDFLVERDDSIYELRAQDLMEHHAAATARDVRPGTLDLEIRLGEQERMAVRVRDLAGRPIEGARFVVASKGRREFPATSTAPGEYSIARPSEPFTLYGDAKGHRRARCGHPRAPLDPATIQSPLEIVLEPAKRVRGRVTAGGMPVAGALVRHAADDPRASGTTGGYRGRYYARPTSSRPAPEELTDADGRFELDADHDAGFWIRATADGWAPTEIGPLDVSALADVTELELVLTSGGAIEGRVLLPDGADGAGTIVGFNHGDSFPFTLRAGPGGVFRADELAPGPWQVVLAAKEFGDGGITHASAETDEPVAWSCTVRAGETTRFDLDLTRR